MTQREKTRRIQTIIVSACVVFALMLMIGLISNIVGLVSTINRTQKLEAEIAALDQQLTEDAAEIEYRKTNEYIERYSREYLEMKNPDEIAFVGK